jgi:hypothetical protein
MRTLPIPTGRLLIVPGERLPEDAENIRVIQITGPAVLYYEFGNSKWTTITIPPGSWSLFGKASELTYEQKGFICKRENGYFEDYCGDGYLFTSVTLSYVSFLTFHGIKPDDYLLIENKK